MNRTVLISSSLLLSTLLPLSTLAVQAAEKGSKNDQQQSAMVKPDRNGTASAREKKDAGPEKVVEDNLKRCLSRIPADSSSGQRLLAEQSCRKDHEARSASHAAPEF
jgi:hypothetical protein